MKRKKVKLPRRWVRRFKTPAARNENILLQHDAGRRLDDIGDEVGLSASQIARIAAKAGRPPRLAMLDRDKVVERYRAGETILEISKSCRAGIEQVSRALRAQGVAIPRGVRPKKGLDQVDAIVTRAKAGETFSEISIALGLPSQVVRRRCREVLGSRFGRRSKYRRRTARSELS